jgi:hypothetical protein
MLNTLQKIVRALLGINAIEDEMLRQQERRLNTMREELQDFCLEIIPHILNGGVDTERVPNPNRKDRGNRYIDFRSEAGQKLHDAIEKSAEVYEHTTRRFITHSQLDTRIENLFFLEPVAIIELINAQINDPALIQPLVERINACQVKG